MPVADDRGVRPALGWVVMLGVFCLGWMWSGWSRAQQVTTSWGSAVGGVAIDPQGMLTNVQADALARLRDDLAKSLPAAPETLSKQCALRKLSLRNLDATVAACLRDGKPIPEAVHLLGGLQQIRYVLVYPEQHDIVLVGPAEGWRVGPGGAVVGASTGRPVMLLDDLVTALRVCAMPTRSVMSCSIDPSPEGLRRLQAHVQGLKTIGNPPDTARGIEQQLGAQRITVQGVPETTHFAHVMVAADYRMKRVSMGLEPSPVAGLSSFLAIAPAGGRGMRNMLPRWWLAPDYDPLLRDADGLTWQFRKASVKTLAESDFFNEAGIREKTAPADPVAQRWAEQMTACYDQWAMAEPVFGQLRNCMDLAVVAALLVEHDLLGKAGLSLPALMGTDGVPTAELRPAKHVASQASLAKKGRNWMIAAGGVQINPWAIASAVEESPRPAQARAEIGLPPADQWCAD